MATDAERDALLNTVRNGSTFEALRAARQLEELTRKRRREEREQETEKEKIGATQ